MPYGEGITYFPLAIMLKPLAGIEDEDSRDEAREKLLALLPGIDDASLVVTRLAGAIGLDDVLARPEEIAWAVRRLLESLANERPRVVFFDDLHWAEPTFLRLVQYLGELGGDRLLLVCSSRPDLSEHFPALCRPPDVTYDRVGVAAAQTSGALIANLLGRRRSAGDRRARRGGRRRQPALHRGDRAHAPRRGADRPARRALGARRDLADVVLPPSIEALLAARLDRLEPAELAVLQRAAVIGRIFGWAAVRALSPEPTGRRRRGARGPAAEGGPLHRRAAPQRRGRLPVRPHPRPRRRLPGPAEETRAGAARALRDLPRDLDRRPRSRVRGDHRLPPRAGVRLPDRARPAQRPAAAVCERACIRLDRRGSAPSSAATCRRRSTSSSARRRSRPGGRPGRAATRVAASCSARAAAEAEALFEQALEAPASKATSSAPPMPRSAASSSCSSPTRRAEAGESST